MSTRPPTWSRFFEAIQALNADGRLLAYHDRSDGGLFVTLLEMAFASGVGLEIDSTRWRGDRRAVAVQRRAGRGAAGARGRRRRGARRVRSGAGSADCRARPRRARRRARASRSARGAELLYAAERACAARAVVGDHARDAAPARRPGLRRRRAREPRSTRATRACTQARRSTRTKTSPRRSSRAARAPRVAILREQGVNGQVEMAAAFDRAGFDARRRAHERSCSRAASTLAGFVGLAACGGFSYGDVLGAGEGWAKSILFNDARARAVSRRSSRASDTFALGVCNGCQMMSSLRELIPGAEHWPRFVQNRSERYEARLVAGADRGEPVDPAARHGRRAHADRGRARRRARRAGSAAASSRRSSARAWWPRATSTTTARVDRALSAQPQRLAARRSPALTTPDGRVTIMMPHPERVFRSVQLSYRPRGAGAKTRPGCASSATRACSSAELRRLSLAQLGQADLAGGVEVLRVDLQHALEVGERLLVARCGLEHQALRVQRARMVAARPRARFLTASTTGAAGRLLLERCFSNSACARSPSSSGLSGCPRRAAP